MSSLKEKINADLKSAMLARDELKTTTLRGLKAVILNEEVAKGLRGSGLADDQIEQLILRESKKRDEAAGLFRKGGNEQSAKKELSEKEILKVYLPKQISEEDLRAIIIGIVAEVSAKDTKDMGKVIGATKTKVGSTAEGALVAKLVKEILEAT